MPEREILPSRVFVLRLWREPSGAGQGAWRASLLNPVSQRRMFFSEPAKLGAFLERLDLNWPDEDACLPLDLEDLGDLGGEA